MTDDDAAGWKRKTEVALDNLRRIGVTPEAAPAGRVAELLSALAGVGKAMKAMPAATPQQAINQAVLIEGAFLALCHQGAALIAFEAVKPILETYRPAPPFSVLRWEQA